MRRVAWSCVVAVMLMTVQGEGTTPDLRSPPDQSTLPPCPPGQRRSEGSGHCCPLCQAGTGATGACASSTPPLSNPASTTTTTSTTTTVNPNIFPANGSQQAVPPGCQPCAPGRTFSAEPGHASPCRPCSACPKNARAVRPCNATHDAVCQCEAGLFYLSARSGQCELCDLCPAGWGASTACRHGARNTVCRKCQNGTFSDVLSATAPCRPCGLCALEERTLQACTATQDTVCVSKYIKVPPVYHFSGKNSRHHDDLDMARGHLNGHVGDQGQNHRRVTLDYEDDDGIDVIPLYCAALGAVVVGLLGYVVSVHYRRIRVKRLAREPHEDVEYSKASGADSGVFVDSEHHHHHHHHHHQHHHHQHHHHQQQKYQCVVITGSTRLKDLPQGKKKELEMTFFAGSRGPADWKSLARELGYNSGKIATFEARSLGSRRGDPRAPYRHLVHDWGRLEGATVSAFQRALRSLGRQDVTKYLQAECSEHLQPLTSAALPQHVV